MKKSNPLLLWVILWVFGLLIITFRNKIVAGTELDAGNILIANLFMDTVLIPVALIGYFILKGILNLVGVKDFFEEQKGLKNITILWLILFLILFLFPLFRK